MISMSMVGRRRQDPRGFTLLEVIVSIAVLGIIMTPLTMAFITAIKQTDELQRNVGASADAQRIAAAWTQDVSNVDPNGVRFERGCNDGTEDEDPLVTFEWDTSPTTVAPGSEAVPKQAMWALRGNGPDAELVRLYCEKGSWVTTDVLATSFWKSGVDTSKAVYGTNQNDPTSFCSVDGQSCTITVDGTWYYSLTVQRRVAGVAPPGLTTPPTPTITGGVCANTTLTAAWLPSVVPAGVPPVDLYGIRVEEELGGGDVASQEVAGAALSASFENLVVGKNYWVQMRAHNTNGWGDWGTEFGPITCNPVAPDAPVNVGAVAGDGQITVSWNAPASNGGAAITAWQVRTRVSASDEIVSSIQVAGVATNSVTVTGLDNGTAVEATVSAINSAGEGSESTPSNEVVPCGVPYAPGEYVIDDNGTPNDPTDDTQVWTPRAPTVSDAGQVMTTVTYLAPYNNGCAITNYRVYATPAFSGADPSPWTTPNDATSYTTPQLDQNTQYQFQVAAINSVGEGALSPLSAAIQNRGVPTAAPGNLQWTPAIGDPDPTHGWPDGNPGGLLTWVPLPNTPEFNGGLSITNYRVDITPQQPGNAPYYLTNGANSDQLAAGNLPQITGTFPNEAYQTYDMTVAAKNDAGLGPAANLTVIPGGRPIASPPNVTSTAWAASASSATVYIHWDKLEDIPQNTGGHSIIGYSIISGSNRYAISGVDNNFSYYGMTPGQTYVLKVAATNDLGDSIPATSITIVAPTVLTAPSSSSVNLVRPAGTVGNRLSLTFPAFTASSGTPTPAYTAHCTAGGETPVDFSGLTVGTNILDSPGLTNGKAWSCSVTGVVTYGDGSTSSATASSNGTAVPGTLASAPGTPTVAALSAGKARITWTAPASNGGLALSGYTISASPALAGFPATVGGSTLTFDTPNPLTFGTPYTFTVAATNVAGTGPGATSAPFSATSSLPTQAPTNLSWASVYPAGGTQPGKLTITWTPVPDTAPANGGIALTSQTITLSPAPSTGSATVVLPIAQSSYTYTTNQVSSGSLVSYTATIYATNGNGNGPSASVAGARSGGSPTATVTGLSSRAAHPNGTIQVDWTPPADNAQTNGGKAIDGYNVYWSTGGGAETRYFVGGANSITAGIGGLTPGLAYTFRVVANNQAGVVAGDAAVWATMVRVAPGPPIAPGTAPTLTKPSGSQGTLILTFNPFTVNSGSPPITGYSAVCTATGGTTVTVTGINPAPNYTTITGLSNTKSYTCALTATNGPFLYGVDGTTTVNAGPTTTGP